MKLWQVHYQDGDHEPERELFVHTDNPRPTTEDARTFLLSIDGMIGDPERLRIDGVYLLDTVHAINGDPYLIEVKE